jgi:HSP20 family protein
MHMNGMIRWKRPALATWRGFGRFNDFQDEIDRLFGAPLAALAGTSEALNGWAPALDVYEDKDNYVVKTELPGMKREDIQVSFHEGSLSISGERKPETKHKDAELHRAERSFGRFERVLTLPTAVASDKVSAQYKDGVLTVTLPKTEAAKPKQIDVTVN